jgi:hypothetical protein
MLRSTVTEAEDYMIELMNKKTGKPPAMESFIGCAVGANAGTKAIGVIIRGKPRK